MRLKVAIALLFLPQIGGANPPVQVRHEPLPALRVGDRSRSQELVPADDPAALAAAIRAGTAFISQPKVSQVGDTTAVYGPRTTPQSVSTAARVPTASCITRACLTPKSCPSSVNWRLINCGRT